MRKIPAHITDESIRQKLTRLDSQIEEKMGKVNAIRAAMKKKDLSPTELQDLKQLGTAIDLLDKEWKTLSS